MIISVVPLYESTGAGVRMTVYHVNRFEGISRHEHIYQHLTYCAFGSIVLRKEGKELILTKDSMPVIAPKNEMHEIEALEDNTVFVNVFAEGKF